MKDGEGFTQRTLMHSPRTQTTMWGLPGGGDREGLGEEGKGRKVGTTVTV